MNYRKLYADRFNIKIPCGYEIHHIDGKRDNNNFNNLVLLPKELHIEYHKNLSKLERSLWGGLGTKANQYPLLAMQCSDMADLTSTLKEVYSWVGRRDFIGYPKEWYKCQRSE